MAIRNSKDQAGFTLIELLIAIAIIGLLAAIAIPRYQGYVDHRDVEQTKTELLRLEHKIKQHYIRENEFPADLNTIGEEGSLDPWGNEYIYALLVGKRGNGHSRKIESEVPLNTDYDLYSVGKDGQTSQSLKPPQSRDDVIRANNGRFIGLARVYANFPEGIE